MLKLVSLQISMTLLAAVIAAMIGGLHAGLSAALGGLACVLPNALFALRLTIQAKRPGGANVASFFFGEFAKLALTVAVLFLVATQYRELNWLALLAGFIVAMKSYLAALLIDRNK